MNVIGAGDLSEVAVLYIPLPTVEKKVVKVKSTRTPRNKAHGYENAKNERVEAILEKNNKKRFATIKQLWKDYQLLVFFVVFVWLSFWLFKPVK